MDRYVEIVKVNYVEPKHEVILGSFLKKSSTAAQPTNKKRKIHRALTIEEKTEAKSQHKFIVLQSRGKKKGRANNRCQQQVG